MENGARLKDLNLTEEELKQFTLQESLALTVLDKKNASKVLMKKKKKTLPMKNGANYCISKKAAAKAAAFFCLASRRMIVMDPHPP